ncbi:potassium channel family protein [Secundilactobacillus malefermentans]|uniref:potassium channel family protein n=1 Tax=Secundilactobacillus malefermentans TaxID=176292 RepID=UPI0011CC17DF|nr:potassium channel family protein [Secundilactobacillus malefermentans]QEA31890.1 potassium channel family protein [Secundilactobacillus malefermentans]
MENEVELKVVMYHWLVVGLTLISFLNVALMIIRLGDWQTEWWVATGLTIIFAIDYGIRLIKAKNRKSFLITSAFDLLGIIPMHPGFVIFRLARLVRIIRYHHLFWHLGISGKWTRNFHRFVYDTGFIYLFAISVAIISLSALLFSIFEHRSLPQALWWAVTTATTVGYGDITPSTAGGKAIAIILMLGGVGFIGLLTSTITDYFTNETADKAKTEEQDDRELLRQLSAQITRLDQKVDKLQSKINQKK